MALTTRAVSTTAMACCATGGRRLTVAEEGGGAAKFTRDALEGIADQALARGTGARGLRAILEEVLLNTMYELPGRTDVGSVVIDADTVATKVAPTLTPREPVTKRPRRQAS